MINHVYVWLWIIFSKLNAALILNRQYLEFRNLILIFLTIYRLVAVIFLSRSWSKRNWIALKTSIKVLVFHNLILALRWINISNWLIIYILIAIYFSFFIFHIALIALLLWITSIFLFCIEIFWLTHWLLIFNSTFSVF